MKNLLDKHSKTVSYLKLLLEIIVLIVGIVILYMTCSTSNKVEVSETNTKADTQVIAVESVQEKPEVTVTPQVVAVAETKPQVIELKEKVIEPKKVSEKPLSRGGTPPKQSNQRDLINKYVREISAKYNIEPELVMSIIVSESDYDPRSTTGKCVGLMQVSTRWHQDRAKKLGVKDFYDPYSNILLGVDYLSELFTQYKDTRLVLMVYNMERKTALNLYKNGQISKYARTIISRAEEFKKGE